MNSLSKTELKDINGGGISVGVALGIGAIVIFAIGVIDGYVNPEKCRQR